VSEKGLDAHSNFSTMLKHPYINTHSQHHEHPKLAVVIISCQSGNLCIEIVISGETKIMIRWVYITEIVVYGILL
jgi:hypothetical protein